MAKTINSDLIRGNINTIILKALFEGDRYGYDIIKEIEEKSHGQYILKQPTLYSCLKRLENQGFIEAYWGEQSSNGGRRKYYRLTNEGREVFKQSQDEYEYSRTVIDTLISDNKYDLDSLPHQSADKDESQDATLEKIEDSSVSASNEFLPSNDEDIDNINEEPTNETAVFSSVSESLPTTNNDTAVVTQETTEETEDFLSPPPSFDFPTNETKNDQSTEIKTEICEVNTSSIVDDLLKINNASYFNRDNTESAKTLYQTESKTSEVDDEITKKLNELQNSYNNIYNKAEESESNEVKKPQNNSETNNNDSYSNGFFKYNKINPEHDKKVSDEERIIGKTLLVQAKKNASTVQNHTTEENSVSIKDQIIIRNFGKLKQSIEELGESAKLRPHTDTSKDFQKQYYYKDNYLRLFSNGIMFVLLLIEIFTLYVVGKLVIGANTQYDQGLYIASIVICFTLPSYAVAKFIHKPDSKKRNDFSLRSSLVFKIIIAIQIILITYAINIYLEMPITFNESYFITLTIPSIFALNLPFSTILFNILRKKEKFSAKD